MVGPFHVPGKPLPGIALDLTCPDLRFRKSQKAESRDPAGRGRREGASGSGDRPRRAHRKPPWLCEAPRQQQGPHRAAGRLGGSQASSQDSAVWGVAGLCGSSLLPEHDKREPRLWDSEDSRVGGSGASSLPVSCPLTPCPAGTLAEAKSPQERWNSAPPADSAPGTEEEV